MTPINFKANYIKPVTIHHYDKGEYKPMEASIVKYDVNNDNDLRTIKRIGEDWGISGYAINVYGDALALQCSQDIDSDNSTNIYMLTLPQDSYEKVKPENVLGCVSLDEYSDSIGVNYLQVEPSICAKKRPVIEKGVLGFLERLIFNRRVTKYKNVGTGILDSIKSIYSDKDTISLISASGAVNFYKKNGFSKVNSYSRVMVWHRDDK